MSDDRAFLDALRADPADDARWLIYADWLDDHNDPRAEYLRLVTHLSHNPDADRRRRLNAVRPTMPREWLYEVEQPALLRANPTPYPPSWPGVGLGDLRPNEATYSVSEYRTLPPVPPDWVVRFDEWRSRIADGVPASGPEMTDAGEDQDAAEWRAINEEDQQTAVPRLSSEASEFGLTLPDEFTAFFIDPRYSGRFVSATDCYFSLPERITPAPDCPEAGLIRFYSDSQGVLYWYLYLTPEGDECVVTSSTYFGGDWVTRQMVERGIWRHLREDEPGGEFAFCAPSFAEFTTRIWLENMAWYSLHPQYAGPNEVRGSKAPEVRAYLDHYRGVRNQRPEHRGQ